MMSKNIIISEIKHLLDALNDQRQMVESGTEPLSLIEIDIMKDTVKKLYASINQLSQIENKFAGASRPEQIAVPLPVAEQIPPTVIIAEEVTETAPQEMIPEEENSPAEVVETVTTEATVVTTVVSESVQQTISAEFKQSKKTKPSTASLFDEVPSLGKSIQAKATVYDNIAAGAEDKSISKKMQSDPVTDLKKSIGINEKFSFINELFDGDLDGYNRAIEQLNSCESNNSALELLEQTFAINYGWNQQTNAFLNLKTLVTRRYS